MKAFNVNHSFCDFYEVDDYKCIWVYKENWDKFGGIDYLKSLSNEVVDVLSEEGLASYYFSDTQEFESSIAFKLLAARKCIRCDKILNGTGSHNDNWSATNDGMDFQGYGNYGTTYFDPAPCDPRGHITILVCDECLKVTRYKQRWVPKDKKVLDENVEKQNDILKKMAEDGYLERNIERLNKVIGAAKRLKNSDNPFLSGNPDIMILVNETLGEENEQKPSGD